MVIVPPSRLAPAPFATNENVVILRTSDKDVRRNSTSNICVIASGKLFANHSPLQTTRSIPEARR
jgi:hypothetical protein